jgi:hypothetical protein
MRRASVAVVVAALLGLSGPASASAQNGPGNPFAPSVPQESATVPTTTAPSVTAVPNTSTSSGGLSPGSAVGIGVGALVVLGGISFFIWRDARRRAPARVRAASAGAMPGPKGSRPRPKPRKLSPAERRRRKRGRAR